MNPSNTQTPNASATWGKPMSVVAFPATAVAIAIARLAQPAASHAEKQHSPDRGIHRPLGG